MSDMTEYTMYRVYQLYALKTMATMSTMYLVSALATAYVYTMFILSTVYTTVTMSAMYMLSAMKTKYTEYSMNTVYTGNTMSIAYKLYSQYTKFTRSIMIVGKTSCCALFAQYLCENGYSVKVLDADIQASLSRHRERELAANPDAVIPWEVSTVDTTDRQNLQSSIEEAMQFDGVVLFDMPGTLNAANLDLLYKAADLAVVPISYDFDTIDATGIFIKVIKRVKDIQLVFLPNRINTTENRADDMKQREETVKILGRIGRVTPRIKQSVVIKRYSTISALDKYQKAAVEHAFNAIVEHIKL